MATSFLSMSPWVFDQGPDGWRALDAAGDLEGAAAAIRQYLNLWARGAYWHALVPQDDQSRTVGTHLLHWHLGQVLASIGPERYEEAIEAMDDTVLHCPDLGFAYYARGTIAFLQGKAEALTFEITRATWNQDVLLRLQEGLRQGKTYRESY